MIKIFHCVVVSSMIIHIAVCNLFFQGTNFWAYLTYLCELFFLIVLIQFLSKEHLNKIEKIGIACFGFMLSLSFIAGLPMSNIVSLIGRMIEIASLLMVFHLNRNSLTPIVTSVLITLSICVYINYYMLLQFPMGFQSADGDSYYLLGSNYNQIGPKNLFALTFNLFLLNKTKWSWINMLALAFCAVSSLYIVGSMTSLVSVSLFLIVFIISWFRAVNKFIIYGGVIAILFFQVFIVFLGGVLSNSFLLDFIDLLDKDTSFTGRTLLWNYSADYFFDSPIWGHGFISSSDYGSSGFFYGREQNSHNLIYNWLHKGGLVLLILLFSLFNTGYKNIKKFITTPIGCCVIMTFISYMMMSLFEAFDTFYFFLIVILMYYYPLLTNYKNENENYISSNTYLQK